MERLGKTMISKFFLFPAMFVGTFLVPSHIEKVSAAAPDLAITVESSTQAATSDSWITYTISFENKGNARAKNVRIAMTLPEQLIYISDSSVYPIGQTPVGIIWMAGTLEVGAKKSFQIDTIASQIGDSSVELVHVIIVISASNFQSDTGASHASSDVPLYPTPSLW
jgi:uncharacterized repeat protein (TIGR01451 family)